jgi:beta-glucosidase
MRQDRLTRWAPAALLLVGVALQGCGSSSSKKTIDTTDPAAAIVAQQAAEWTTATAKAQAVAAVMTRAEIIQLIIGATRPSTDPHFAAGYVPAVTVSATGMVIPAQYLCDSPNGVGNSNTNVTRFPTGITVAATWDKDLARAFGDALGAEWFGKGCIYGLGPAMNIIRLPYGGRSAEYYSEDPFLAGQVAASEILGIQAQHVVATAKHYAANNQETERSGGNSDVSERALREIYLPAFERSVKEGGAGSLMCSYNRINGIYACANDHVQNEIARGDWGFGGSIMSDWGANHGNSATLGLQFAQGGLDVDMPGGTWSTANLAGVSDAYLRTMATRVLAAMYKVGIFDVTLPTVDGSTSVSTDAHKALAEQLSAAGTVLLKNVNGALPLDPGAPLNIVVIGGAASTTPQSSIGGSGVVNASETVVTPLAGITARATNATVTYSEGSVGTGSLSALSVHSTQGATTDDGWSVSFALASGAPLYNTATQGAFPVATGIGTLPNQTCTTYPGWGTFCRGGSAYLADGTSVSLTTGAAVWTARYTGYVNVATAGSYEFKLRGNGGATLYVDGVAAGTLQSPMLTENVDYLVALSAAEHRIELRYDSSGLTWFSAPSISLSWSGGVNELDAAVAAAQAADVAIVVVSDAESEGSDHSAFLPGSQNLLVERVAAVAKKTIVVMNTGSGLVLPWADKVDAILENWYGGQRMGTAIASILFGDVNPSGRSVVTFPISMSQWYAQQQSQFPGVYTTASSAYHTVSYGEGIFPGYRWFDQNQLEPLFPFGHGLSYTTFAYSDLQVSASKGDGSAVAVTAKVTNTGTVAGAEVAQLYLGFPDYAGEPPRQLKGFEKVTLAPGASATVTFYLSSRSFSFWDSTAGAWKVPVGQFQLDVGASSRDIRLTGSYTVQ